MQWCSLPCWKCSLAKKSISRWQVDQFFEAGLYFIRFLRPHTAFMVFRFCLIKQPFSCVWFLLKVSILLKFQGWFWFFGKNFIKVKICRFSLPSGILFCQADIFTHSSDPRKAVSDLKCRKKFFFSEVLAPKKNRQEQFY